MSDEAAKTRGGDVDPKFWKGRRVLVTGHTGFKGSWLTIWLEQMGAKVIGLALPPDTNPSMFEALDLAKLCEHNVADLRDRNAVEKIMRASKAEVLFHLAAQPLVRKSYAEPVETYATNVMGTVNVLDALRRCESLRSVVCITSDKCYENREWVWGYRENEPMGGFDPYSSSKACAELVIAAYRRSYFADANGPAIASARAGNVIGGGDWSADRLIPDAMRAFAKGESVIIRNPQSIRPWQHVIEPLRGYLMLAEACWRDRKFADAWNFGPSDDDARPVSALMDRAVEIWGKGARWSQGGEPSEPHEAKFLRLDCSKARNELGWQPRIDLPRALRMTVEWYSTQGGAVSSARLIELSQAQLAAHGMAARR